MSKRVRKNNYTSYSPYHLYGFGSGLKQGIGDFNFSSTDLGAAIGENIGAFGSAAGGMVGGLLSNGLESKAGGMFNAIGDLGSMIPGPAGAIIGGGAKIVGGLVNATFGTKVNQEKLNAANMGTNYLNSFISNASTFDEIKAPQAQAPVEDAYKGGLFSGRKAKKRNAELRRQRQEAQLFANRSVENNIDNIAEEQMNNMLASYTAFGGPLHTSGANWTNGITIIGTGGTHESNPLGGVPMGIAPDGKPNLVEEGEAIFNDYVFSNRLKVPKAVREKYKLRGAKDMTFADAAKKIQKESEERPNDPISQRGLESIMNKLTQEQEFLRQKRQDRKYAKGGAIYIDPSKRGTFTAAASKHDMGVQEFASKVLANPDSYSPAMRKKAQFAKNASKWKHAYGGIMGRMFNGDGEDPQFLVSLPKTGFSYSSLIEPTITTSSVPKLTPMQQIARDKTIARGDGYTVNVTDNGTNFKLVSPTLKQREDGDIRHIGGQSYNGRGLTGLRFVPAIGAGLGVFSDLMGWTNKPDYSNAQSILDAASSIGDVRFSPIGDYMRYTPLDRLFYANQLGAQAGATRRSILNTSGGNRGTAMAGLLSADYNAQGQLGNLFRQAEEYNLGQRERVAAFNRGTNMFNAENTLKAQMANRENAKIKVDAAARAAAIRGAIDDRIGAARSANLTNLFNSLGDIGREAFTMNMVMSNPALYYSIDRGTGNITYKNGFDELSEGHKAQIRRAAERDRDKGKARGGYLTIRRRR